MQSSLSRFFLSLFFVLGFSQSLSTAIPSNFKTRRMFSKKDCTNLIKQLETDNSIPSGLLEAISSVESEHTPYAVNCNGKSRLFTNHDAAKSYVRGLRDKGIIDINIGVLQINYAYHQNSFKEAEHILDPYRNVAYAAKYLASLKKIHGSWAKAVKFYHSPVARYQNMYFAKVMNALKRINKNTHQDVFSVKPVSFKPVVLSKVKAAA